MATYYVSSVDGNNADSGADWTNAKQTVAGALSVATSDGDIILVDSAHNYAASSAAISWNPSAGIHVSIISVDRSTGAHTAGAKETADGFGNGFNICNSNSASLYIKGMEIVSADDGSTNVLNVATVSGTPGARIYFENCTLRLPGNWSQAVFNIGPDNSSSRRNVRVMFRACTIYYCAATDGVCVQPNRADVQFIGCTFNYTSSGSIPGTFCSSSGGLEGRVRFIDCDLSSWNKTTKTVEVTTFYGQVEFVNCKLNASATLPPTGTWPDGPGEVTYINCDSGDTTYKYAHFNRFGQITVSTSIYASSGAQVDANALSWKIETSAACDEKRPYFTPWLAQWLSSTGSKTFSFELVYDSATNLTDREVWAEFEALEDASYTLGTVTSTRNSAPLTGTGTDLSAGAASWTGTGGFTNANADKVSTTRTVNQKGLARGRLVIGKASQTLYLDPQLRVA